MSIDQSVLDKFEAVVESQRKRIMDMKAQDDFIDYSKLDKLIIGVCGGDGIGPMITGMAQHALEVLLADKVKAGKVEFRVIDGLTIEALWEALKRVQERAPKEAEEAVFQLRNIHRENFTVEGCMETIESRLSVGTVRFSQLFSGTPDREEVVTLFMALLELLKLGKAHVMQTGNFGEMTLLPGRRESDLGEE